MMSLRKSLAPALAALLGSQVSALAADAPDAATAMTEIVIVIRSKAGESIEGTVMRKDTRRGPEWVEIGTERQKAGHYLVREAHCSAAIWYRVESANPIYQPSGEQEKSCKAPEMTFAEFVDLRQYASISMGANVDWTTALASYDETGMVTAELSQAYASREYGRAAIIGSELAAQFRAAGNLEAATFFGMASMQATTEGIIATGKIDVPASIASGPIIDLDYMTGKPELVRDAVELNKTYQVEVLGRRPTGKADWSTMRSLPGGAEAYAPRYDLSEDALRSFDLDRAIATFQ